MRNLSVPWLRFLRQGVQKFRKRSVKLSATHAPPSPPPSTQTELKIFTLKTVGPFVGRYKKNRGATPSFSLLKSIPVRQQSLELEDILLQYINCITISYN